MNTHAVFAPSAAHRWFRCPGSIRLSDGIPERSSIYSDEGTAAHELAARCIANDMNADSYVGEVIKVGSAEFFISESMAQHVQTFLDYVWELEDDGYELHSEVRLDLGHLHPGQYGTGDGILFNREHRHLVVADFKYGAGVYVEVKENPQLMSYGSGAFRLFHNAGVDKLTLTIVQPRAPGTPTRYWECPVERLKIFELEFKAAAEAAMQPNAPLVSGEWCRFCLANSICPELKNAAFAAARAEFNSNEELVVPKTSTLSPKQLGKILSQAHMLEIWMEGVKKHALQSALAGETPDGFKLVRKNTNRKWLDEEKTASALVNLFELDPEAVYTKKIVSPAQAEKLLGKSNAKALASLVTRPPGDATLAPNADRRPAMAVDAIAEFRTLLETSAKHAKHEED